MKTLKTAILPIRHEFATKGAEPHELDFEAICIFAATGFFMGSDTYWKDRICLLPNHEYRIDTDGVVKDSKPYFDWHYSPRQLSFEDALDDYVALLTTITKSQIQDKSVILPLSGGLDSRSQALILKDFDNPVHAYSYSFEGGFPEHTISAQVAKVSNFEFEAFKIKEGYLWDTIDELAKINQCYSEFTHPRQMAVLPQLKQMQGIFSLGHWGDVFFDRGAPDGLKESDIIPLLLKKMVKPGGLYLAEKLWEHWGLDGAFKDYLISRIETALSKIKIENVSAKVRAFKTSQWAHRWTTTNLSVFESAHPITLPYYDNRMCEFICTIPEDYLADRRLQIAHLRTNKEFSNITWQAQNPFNLNTFEMNKAPYNLPYRILDKLKRERAAIFGKPYIQRNFELQFLGEENDKQLRRRLFSDNLRDVINKSIVSDIYDKFKNDNTVFYSHPTSLLLTLSLWSQHYNQTS